MVVSLFLAIALVFGGLQVYRIQSSSAEIQEVADACVLAAENEVAGLKVIANTCDAACLSLTLLSVSLYGLGIVATCVPPAAEFSVKLIDAGSKTADLRNKFYERACAGLNTAQRLLPFIATCNALRVAQANNAEGLSGSYFAGALLIPADFTALGSVGNDGLGDAREAIQDSVDDVRKESAEAEEAAQEALEAKKRGFMADCGSEPSRCMRERATSLAGLANRSNPSFASVDTWSFSVALNRARAYYKKRLSAWKLEGLSTEAKADSIIRKRFYEYACEQLKDAFVKDEAGSFSYSLPSFFKNTKELKHTELYDEKIYPVTITGATKVMHAWAGCGRARDYQEYGSVKELDTQRSAYSTCDLCKFVPSSVGSVAAATTNTTSGFEHHYELMRKACEDYAKAREASDPLSQGVKSKVELLFDALKEVLAHAGKYRIHIEPPGRKGALALVVGKADEQVGKGVPAQFGSSGASVGIRVAVSGATLLEDKTEPAGAFVTQSLESFANGIGLSAPGHIAATVTSLWMNLIKVYEDGQNALLSGVKDGLNLFSQNSCSGLGNWESDVLRNTIQAFGLEPAHTGCEKPLVLNTSYVAESDDSSVSVKFLQAKATALSGSSGSTSGFQAIATGIANSINEKTDGLLVQIAEIKLPFSGGVLISWAIPQESSSDPLTLGDLIHQGLVRAEEAITRKRVWQ